jgi:hypothetical protein
LNSLVDTNSPQKSLPDKVSYGPLCSAEIAGAFTNRVKAFSVFGQGSLGVHLASSSINSAAHSITRLDLHGFKPAYDMSYGNAKNLPLKIGWSRWRITGTHLQTKNPGKFFSIS